jgi:hypothetical protein
MFSQQAARAFGRNICSRSRLNQPCVFHRLGTWGDSISLRTSRIFQVSNQRSSSSSARWKNRQGRDLFAREAKVQGLKSRAAFKLLEVWISPGLDLQLLILMID